MISFTVDTVYAGSISVAGGEDTVGGYCLRWQPDINKPSVYIEGLDTMDLLDLIEALRLALQYGESQAVDATGIG